MKKPNNIYFYRPDLPKVDTSKLFNITTKTDTLRVKNSNVNCLFSNLTKETFDKFYNDFLSHLNLNFLPITFNNKTYELTDKEQTELQQLIITDHIYFYTINNLPIVVKRSDFVHPKSIYKVIWLLDKKFNLRGQDTQFSLKLGAHILRQDFKEYCTTVKGLRIYSDR